MPQRRSPAALSPPSPPDHVRRIAVEEWFLRRGMPSVARSSSGLRRLLLRAVPVLIGYAAISIALTLADVLLRAIDPEVHATLSEPETVLPQWFLTSLVVGLVLSIAAGLLANGIVRRPLGDRASRLVIAGTMAVLLLLPPVDALLGTTDAFWEDYIGDAIVIVVTMVLIKAGLGAVFAWSVRQALSQGSALISLAARALPMIVLVTLFAFLSEGLWRVSGALSRGELWVVVAILIGIAAIFIGSVIRGEMRLLMADPRCSPDEMRAHGFPAHGGAFDTDALGEPVRLTRRETANALVVLFIALAIQIGALVVLVFAFFCVFGAITVPASVSRVWTGHEPTVGVLMGYQLPVANELIQTSLLLAAFSAVSFAASSITDPMYRKAFFEPILRDMRVTLAARNVYRLSDGAGRLAGARTPAAGPRAEPTSWLGARPGAPPRQSGRGTRS